MVQWVAITGALACVPPIFMQIGLTLGMPWGEYANGGKFPRKLPPAMRAMAVVQGAILAVIALTLLDRGGVLDLGWPAWVFWLCLTIACLSCIANWITPSVKERRLWGPLTTVFALSGIILAFAAQPVSARTALVSDYHCPAATKFEVFNGLGADLYKLTGGNIALYAFAPPEHVLRLEWANLFGAGFRVGDVYFRESTEGRHELVHTPTNTRVDCLPNPASPRAIQKRPRD
ncbi:MAG: hypothetical protein AAGG69_03650 [Pseudomonadota bacterium]